MWYALVYVSSGFTLIAFLALVARHIFTTKTKERLNLIRVVDRQQRAALVRDALEFFHVDTSVLTKEKQFRLAQEQIRERGRRYRTAAAVVCFLVVVVALLTGYFTYVQKVESQISSPANSVVIQGANVFHNETIDNSTKTEINVDARATQTHIDARSTGPNTFNMVSNAANPSVNSLGTGHSLTASPSMLGQVSQTSLEGTPSKKPPQIPWAQAAPLPSTSTALRAKGASSPAAPASRPVLKPRAEFWSEPSDITVISFGHQDTSVDFSPPKARIIYDETIWVDIKVFCSHTSGMVFPVGSTVVTCSAYNYYSGSTIYTSFKILVQT